MRGRGLALLRLAAALALGRARSAFSRRFGVGGVLSGALFQLATNAMLVFAGLFYAWVAASLIGTLARRGVAESTAAAAGAHLDLVLILVLLTTLLSDADETGLDSRPLAPLALGRTERLIAGLLEELVLRPAAIIVWPSALALLIGVGQADSRAALLSVPGAVGLVLLALGTALVVRRLAAATSGGESGASLGVILLRMALVLLPLAWALGAVGSLQGSPVASASPFRPGFWMAGVVRSALAGERIALVWGAAPILVGLGLLLTAARIGTPGLESINPALRPRNRHAWRPPAESLRVWRLPRVRLVVAQAFTAGLVVVVLAIALASRGVIGPPVASLAALLVAWIVAAGPAAFAANALGAGGAPGAFALSVARRPFLWLLRCELWIVTPSALAACAASLGAAWILGAPRSAWLGSSLAVGIACASAGAGALASVVWPWGTPLGRPGDPVWPPGPGRWVLPIAQGVPLSVAAAALLRQAPYASAASCGMIVASGAIVGAACFSLARRSLARRRAAVVEKLLA